jgi:hypothetical protein
VREILVEAKEAPCADCDGVFPPVVMDFHHRGDRQKTVRLADWSRRVGWGPRAIERLLAELAECDVLCANCHRLRHLEEMEGSWRGSRTSVLAGTR